MSELPTEIGAIVSVRMHNLKMQLDKSGWFIPASGVYLNENYLKRLVDNGGWEWENSDKFLAKSEPESPINPKHYTHFKGLEVIDLAEQLNYNRGNVVKYVSRAGVKNAETEMEDLEKARWYIEREIKRVRGSI